MSDSSKNNAAVESPPHRRSEEDQADPAACVAPESGAATGRVRTVLAVTLIGLLLQCAASWSLWWLPANGAFPCIPLFRALVPVWSPWPDRVAALGLLSAAMLVLYHQLPIGLRRPHTGPLKTPAVLLVFGLMAVALNQHRGQVWWWHAAAMLLLADAATPRRTLRRWRAFVVSIYLWSALSKLDPAFAMTHGRVLMQTLCGFAGIETRWWSAGALELVGWFPPAFELLVAALLVFRRTRIIGLWGALSMHGALLLVLGPWGLGHSVGVLLWNALFLVQDVLLFARSEPPVRPAAAAEEPDATEVSRAEAAAAMQAVARGGLSCARTPAGGTGPGRLMRCQPRDLAAAVLIVLPALWYADLLDDWPAWAVYAARTPRVSVQIRSDAADTPRFPPSLRPYMRIDPATAAWLTVDVDRWSLEAVGVPRYPGERFAVGVAIALAERIGADAVRLVVRSRDAGPAMRSRRPRDAPPSRIATPPSVVVATGLRELRRRADRFWINAWPRHVGAMRP